MTDRQQISQGDLWQNGLDWLVDTTEDVVVVVTLELWLTVLLAVDQNPIVQDGLDLLLQVANLTADLTDVLLNSRRGLESPALLLTLLALLLAEELLLLLLLLNVQESLKLADLLAQLLAEVWLLAEGLVGQGLSHILADLLDLLSNLLGQLDLLALQTLLELLDQSLETLLDRVQTTLGTEWLLLLVLLLLVLLLLLQLLHNATNDASTGWVLLVLLLNQLALQLADQLAEALISLLVLDELLWGDEEVVLRLLVLLLP